MQNKIENGLAENQLLRGLQELRQGIATSDWHQPVEVQKKYQGCGDCGPGDGASITDFCGADVANARDVLDVF